jgi:membrane protease YdiL (CAAX protease family)
MGPAAYVVASYAAIGVALPTLLAELSARGRQAVQESSGEFGRQLAASGLGLAVVWGVVVSPVAEELMFRGGVWSAVQSLADHVRGRFTREVAPPTSTELPEGVLEPSRALAFAQALGRFFAGGGLATAASAGLFAALHADMPGGLGIVRWMSALGLGLFTGLARQLSGGIWVPILLHVVFNACALSTTRRWLVTESFGQKLGVPILLSILAGCLALLGVGLALATSARKRTRRARIPT